MNKYPLKIAAVYLVLSLAWLGITSWMVLDEQYTVHWNFQRSLKDILFVLVTSFILYAVMHFHYRQLQRKELQYSTLFGDNPYPMLVYDPETMQVLLANNAFLQQYGYRQDDLPALKLTDTVWPEEELAIIDFVKKVEEKTFSDSGIWRQKTKTGQSFNAKIASHITHFNNKKARIIMAMEIDSEELSTGRSLKNTENKLQTLIDNSSDYMYLVDPQLCIVHANTAFREIFMQLAGVTQFSLPFDLTRLPHTQENLLWQQRYREVLSGKSIRLEETVLNPATARQELHEVVMNPVHDDHGVVIGAACFARDITTQRDNEAQIKKQFDALKEITRMQSHDLRKHLANIISLCNLISEEPENTAFHQELIPLIKQSCEDLDQVIRQVTAKAAPDNTPSKPNG
jgi:PAS domain S-box-containing protein